MEIHSKISNEILKASDTKGLVYTKVEKVENFTTPEK
jgi:hypothetical protein